MAQVILITGASKGIGLAMARQLQAAGHVIYGTSRNPANANINDVTLVPLDVTDSASVHSCVDTVMQDAGRIDVLINNAGYDLYGAAEDTTFDELYDQMDTNFYGVVRLTQAVLPILRIQGSGKIINISSIGGLLALPFNGAYAASKFALEGYSESLRYELLPFDIHVSLVEPGQVNTATLDTSIRPTKHSTTYASRRITANARDVGRKATLTPGKVAAQVVRIVATRQPRLRYYVGMQTHMTMRLRRLLPARWFESFVMRQFVQPVLPEQTEAPTLAEH